MLSLGVVDPDVAIGRRWFAEDHGEEYAAGWRTGKV